MRCIAPITVNGNQFNCGHCRACRVNYTSSWALRLLYELSDTNAASFITLTYSDEYRPYELKKKDLQDFWKRLRQNMKRKYHEFAPRIRYYACGEYGSTTDREHFHAIVFGLDCYNDEHRQILKDSWPWCEPWMFDKSRGRNSGMQEVTPEDIRYVTGYIQKKLDGEKAKEQYGKRQSPFSVCSQGLGLSFAEKNKDRLINNGFTFYRGHKVAVPRYFCEKFGVKRSDLIKNENVNTKEIELSNKVLMQHFLTDMKRKNIATDVDRSVLERLFASWYDNSRYALSEAVWHDFRQRSKLGGKF